MSTRTTIITIIISLCCNIIAQSTKELQSLDNAVSSLIKEDDNNKYDYDHQIWIENAYKIISRANYDSIKTYKPTNMGKIEFEEINTIVLYYIHYKGQPTITWIAKKAEETNRKESVNTFTDNITNNINEVKPIVRKKINREMLGFEIADSITGKQIYWMPDLRIRIDFETIADIRGQYEDKLKAERVITLRLKSFFGNNEALTEDIAGFPRLYSVTNKQKNVRIVTYMTVFDDMSSRCNGLVIKRNENGTITTFELDDKTEEINSPERVKLTNKKWYGAVYYDMIETNYNKHTYYTLLGYKSNDGVVKTRVIDVMTFNGKKCQFGAPIFEHEKATYSRRVFRYSAGVNMMIRYDEKKKSIVFDHLSPEKSMYIGEFRFYGPDFSYDSYLKGSKFWMFKEDIELRNSN